MPDPDWFKPSTPAAPRQPKPGEHVWILNKNGSQIDCELRFHGEPYGCEAQILLNGELRYGQRFLTLAAAMRAAENRRQRLVNEGWTPPLVARQADQ